VIQAAEPAAFISKWVRVPVSPLDRDAQRKGVVDGLLKVRPHLVSIMPDATSICTSSCASRAELSRSPGTRSRCRTDGLRFRSPWGTRSHPDRHHVVAPAQQPSVEAREGTPASAEGQLGALDLGPISDNGNPARPKFVITSSPTCRSVLPRPFAVEHFSDELAFNEVNSPGLNFAFKAVSTTSEAPA